MRTPAKWWRSVKRRKPEIYAYRTDCHRNPMRREWGYVGETWRPGARQIEHTVGGGHYKATAKPWSDLHPTKYVLVKLPWWLAWKWVMRPIETLFILLLQPRYNHDKNLLNRRRIPLSVQASQRRTRDEYGLGRRAAVQVVQLTGTALRVAGVLCLLAALGFTVSDHL